MRKENILKAFNFFHIGEIIDKRFGVSVGISGLTADHKPVTILDFRSNNR